VTDLHAPSREQTGTRTHDDETVSEPRRADAGIGEPPTVGTSIARYVVLAEIARGGMGRVLRAYDPKLQREVALKEVRRDMLGKDAAARLVVEARAMAKLSHPNVVAVYDVEEPSSGEVVLVMEYVPGRTLATWLDGAEHEWPAVVGRFEPAGRGLAAAHDAGLLHRDFKPANVLVSDDGMVKVTDFGLAKSAGDASASLAGSTDTATASTDTTTNLTQAGTVMGTPRYMAPEQHVSEALSPAVDQYAFCVALWEALCGSPPFSGGDVALAKHKLAGPPAWPRASVPRPIADAIVRGLAPAPSDRWPSMAALLEALAWDPARTRRRWWLGAAAVGGLGVAAMTWQAWVAGRTSPCTGAEAQLARIWDDSGRVAVKASILGIGKSYATAVWERTEQELDAYASAWTAMHTESCEATTVRGEQSEAVLDLRMACLHRSAVGLGAVVAQLADADADVVERAHELIGGLRPLSRCADVEALQQAVEPPLPAQAAGVESVRAQVAAAESALTAGRYDRAKEAVGSANALLEGVEYGPVRTEVALVEAGVLHKLGDFDGAEAAYVRSMELAARWWQTEELADATQALLFLVAYERNRVAEGLRYVELLRGLGAGDPQREARLAHDLALVLKLQGKLAEAEAEHRRVLVLQEGTLGSAHPEVARSRDNLAVVLQDEGKYEEAEAEHRRALALWEEILGPEHPGVALSYGNLSNALVGRGKYAEAEQAARRALELQEKALGPEHRDVAASSTNVANTLYMQGDYARAETSYRKAIGILERVHGPDAPESAAPRGNLAAVLVAQGKLADAVAEQRRVLTLVETALGPEHPNAALVRYNLGSTLYRQGELEPAEAELRRALALREKALGAEHPQVATTRTGLAEVLLARGRVAEAVPLAEQAWARQEQGDVAPVHRLWMAFVLARALWDSGDAEPTRRRARQLAEQARDACHESIAAGGPHEEDLREIEAWLGSHRVDRATRAPG
jgi:tetratricopeptide (TPR) repeat protein